MLPGGAVHGAKVRATGAVNASKPLQTEFPLLAVMPTPALVTRAELLLVQDEAHAVRLSLGNRKNCAVAAALHLSAGMLSLCAHGKRRIPDAKLYAFCVLCGTQLLKQHRELQERLAELDGDQGATERRFAASLTRSAA
jgi:hypothetical protein